MRLTIQKTFVIILFIGLFAMTLHRPFHFPGTRGVSVK
jgi:hypothetical protein